MIRKSQNGARRKMPNLFFLRHVRHEYESSHKKAVGEAISSSRVRFISGNKENV